MREPPPPSSSAAATEPEAAEAGRRSAPGSTSFELGGDLHLPPMDYWAVIGPYLDRQAKSLDQVRGRV